jgi:hypothetical protein
MMVEATPRNPGSTRVGGSVCQVKRRQSERCFALQNRFKSPHGDLLPRAAFQRGPKQRATAVKYPFCNAAKTLEPNVIYMLIPKRIAGGSMPDDAFLRHVERQLLLIAQDCFDLRAKESLRLLREEVARRLSVPPIILSKDTNNDPEVTGQ